MGVCPASIHGLVLTDFTGLKYPEFSFLKTDTR